MLDLQLSVDDNPLFYIGTGTTLFDLQLVLPTGRQNTSFIESTGPLKGLVTNTYSLPTLPHGHGIVLWFQVDDFDSAVERAHALKAEIIEGPLFNPALRHREIWLRDADGYVVVLASPDGESGS